VNWGRSRVWACAGLAVVGCAALALAAAGGPGPQEAAEAGRPPHLEPDCTGTLIPPNIAPLNFRIDEDADSYAVGISGARGDVMDLRSRDGSVRIPTGGWRSLLQANRGGEIRFDVTAYGPDGARRFETVTSRVSDDEIDRWLVYRLLHPAYNLYSGMGIYQRDLEGFGEAVVLHSDSVAGGCLNCHTFRGGRTDLWCFQSRRGYRDFKSGMVLIGDGTARKVDTGTAAPPVYSSWHPSGRVSAFSMNKVRQFFHSHRSEIRDVCDLSSDLAVYVVERGVSATTAAISRPDRMETYPCWSADGRYLYYCSAPQPWGESEDLPPQGYDRLRYDLMRIACDIDKPEWGEAETVLSAAQTGLSITLPRTSPDGRFLAFCVSDYGCFPVYQESADICLMDLETRAWHKLPINSERADTWHSWSSNGRWLVFSSKRGNGLLARPHFTHVDTDGTVSKPFVLPQRDPGFYDAFLRTYNVPELVVEPVPLRGEDLARAVRSLPEKALTTRASPGGVGPVPAGIPWSPRL
jgi:hypothetical protein